MDEAPLRDLDALTDVFSSDPDRRSALAALLGPLMGTGALLLPYLFLTPLPGPMRARWLYPLLGAAAVGLGLGALALPKLLLPWGAVLLTNTVLHLAQRRRLSNCVAPLRWLNRLISVAGRVEGAGPNGWSRWFPTLRVDLRALALLRRTSAWLIHDSEESDDLGALVRQYLNAFFLLELNALAWSLRDLHLHAGAMERTFEALGTIDAALSVASVRAGRRWTRPALRPQQPSLEIDEAVHPLIERPVPNSFSTAGGLLFTGSNMSGKSTFLRTVGVNAVLAQTIFTVFAESYRAPFFRVETAIGMTDSLLEGKSYFLAELERIRGFLAPDPSGVPHLLLLDELFRGTNAIERIAAGSAVLCHLARLPGQVLVASHDLELAPLLGDAYASFHFRELIEDGELRLRLPASARAVVHQERDRLAGSAPLPARGRPGRPARGRVARGPQRSADSRLLNLPCHTRHPGGGCDLRSWPQRTQG